MKFTELANDGPGTPKLPKAGTLVTVVGGVLHGKQGTLAGSHNYSSLGRGERYYKMAKVKFVDTGTTDIFEIPVARLRLVEN